MITPSIYAKLYELVNAYSAASSAVKSAESTIEKIQLSSAKELMPELARVQAELANLESQIKAIVDKYSSELFPEDKRSHKTPFGTLEFHASTSLEFDKEEMVIANIFRFSELEDENAKLEKRIPRWKAKDFLRMVCKLNIERLENESDEFLNMLGIHREKNDNFKIKPLVVKADKLKKEIA